MSADWVDPKDHPDDIAVNVYDGDLYGAIPGQRWVLYPVDDEIGVVSDATVDSGLMFESEDPRIQVLNEVEDEWLYGPDAQAFMVAVWFDRARPAQRSKMERFGTQVYAIMDGESWSSDTVQAIGDLADAMGMPFSSPDADQ